MGGTTAHGYPYVSPTDHPKEWPAASQALANVLEAQNMAVGGVSHGSASVPSSTTGSTAFTVVGTPLVWGGMTVNASGLVTPVTGRYRITLQAAFPTGTGGTIRAAWIWNQSGIVPDPNGQPIVGYAPPSANTTGIGNSLTASGVWQLDAGMLARIYLRHDAGSALTVTGTLTMELLRAT